MDRAEIFDVFRREPKQDSALVKFRRSFITVTNLLLLCLLLTLMIVASVANYNQQVSEVSKALNDVIVAKLIETGHEVPDDVRTDDGDDSDSTSKSSIQIYPDGSGGIELDQTLESPRNMEGDGIVATVTYYCEDGGEPEITSSTGNLSMDVVDQAVDIALGYADDDPGHVSQGSIGILGLRYSAFVGDEGEVVVVFASGNFIKHSVVSLLVSLGVPALIVLVLFFFASVVLSAYVVRPLEESWKRQQRFIADASHELKTPLTVIMASNSLMQADPQATIESQKRWVDTIGSESERMLDLVNDMLFLAKTSSIAVRGNREMIDFSRLVTGEVLQFESLAFERGVRLESRIMDDIFVNGIPAQLKRLVGTLIDNACKYAGPDGEAEVVLLKRDMIVVLQVWNTGPAIPEEDLPYIFDRFYRADKARTRQKGGFGLGLSIAKDIVESHGGKIRVKSSDEKGTFFIVRLPFAVR